VSMRFFLCYLLVITLSGCINYAVSRYSVSVDNVTALKEKNLNKKINVGKFSSYQQDLSVIVCRGAGPIITPDGELYSEYIRKALVDELKMSGLYSIDAPITLTGRLNTLTLSSTGGYWDISLSVKSSNGQEITVEENYNFQTSFLGDNACNQTSLALMPAVQKTLSKVLTGNNFDTLVK
jgi:hypothetical protein